MTSSRRHVLSPTLKSCEFGEYRERWSEDLERLAARADFCKRHSITAENIVLGKDDTPTSLDIYGQFSPTYSKSNLSNPWSKKKGISLCVVWFEALSRFGL